MWMKDDQKIKKKPTELKKGKKRSSKKKYKNEQVATSVHFIHTTN